MSGDIFKSADWAREAAQPATKCACLTCANARGDAIFDYTKPACDPDRAVEIEAARLRAMGPYLAGLPENPLGCMTVTFDQPIYADKACTKPVYLDAHGDLWTIGLYGSKPVKLTV